jgi:hypothetical protein
MVDGMRKQIDLSWACSLDDAQLKDRRAEWRAVADKALIDSTPREGGFTARYRGDEETARALEGLVSAERECCPGIDWRLEHDGDVISLDVTYDPTSEAAQNS